jgi:hypothetical protein
MGGCVKFSGRQWALVLVLLASVGMVACNDDDDDDGGGYDGGTYEDAGTDGGIFDDGG